jgi:RNA polymerase sigma factor (sigma-70 family)
MRDDIHPTFFDLVPSVANVIVRRFQGWVTREDVCQECWVWAVAKNSHFLEQLNEPDHNKRQQYERRIAYQMRRAAERYARKEKASKVGYNVHDEAFYETTTIAQLLPFIIQSVLNGTVLEQAQDMVNDGSPKKQSVPAESGNLLAILMDIKKAYQKLEPEDQKILELRYHDSYTLQQIAQYLECAVSTADRRCANSMRKLQDLLGGDSPWY